MDATGTEHEEMATAEADKPHFNSLHIQSDSGLMNLSKPIFENGRYRNPWDTWRFNSLWNSIKFIRGGENKEEPKIEELDRTLPIIKPNFEEFCIPPTTGVRYMWIGHASTLVQVDGVTILTDPIFSNRCSPVQFMGPKRYRDPPCTIDELPHIDIVVISHNHYDHLDLFSVETLNRKYGKNLRWYVPVGIGKWMSDRGCENVVELSWWDEDIFTGRSEVKVVCTPCQHWCKRTVLDTNKALWSSWAVIGPKHSFFFGGDTGYCEAFKEIGWKYGNFTLAALPIGCFKPSWFLSPQHVGPQEAVQIHRDIKAVKSVGIHWGTFKMMAHEHYLEPRETLTEEVSKAGLKPDDFVTVNHGEIYVF
ncbi:N-acyl-phosphatidylethanolamine-hydrolyzing phospholipase D-like [Haliotis asinina]|uniref:N-acyl-phosphatidylethanolamine-hydrolyzing phospholipase D-like n=1 Tax=Haliotis asinina TaxID=109174 RepID=UPI0035326E85